MSRTFRRSAEEQYRRQASESRYISPSRRAQFKRSMRKELISSLLYDDDDPSPEVDPFYSYPYKDDSNAHV